MHKQQQQHDILSHANFKLDEKSSSILGGGFRGSVASAAAPGTSPSRYLPHSPFPSPTDLFQWMEQRRQFAAAAAAAAAAAHAAGVGPLAATNAEKIFA